MSANPWYHNIYRRNVVDMHITDDDDRFMRQFDARKYVKLLALSGVQSAVVYAHSHVGLCFYPSRIGPMHKGLDGHDIVAEVVDRCHKNDIHVVLYLSLIHDTWAYRNHPDWQIKGADGQGIAERSRYGLCCPNSPYREYTAAMAREVAAMPDIAGVRFDMTFWPAVCYCPYCQKRYAEEMGDELPKTIDWQDPRWVRFARQREAWLNEYAARQTETVKSVNPGLSVEHQASTFPLSWRMGVTTALAAHNDFLQGDFYGDALQGSVVRKLFHNLSPKHPAGFETSIGVDLRDYTALKSEDLLEAKAAAALADGCAFIFIDSIDPTGTLNPVVYERMARVFGKTRDYEPYVGGEFVQDVGVYLSTLSKFDPADNGKAVNDPHLSSRMPHVEAVLNACKSLLDRHIPFGVITDRNLHELSRHKIVILPNVLMMSENEANALREYVRAGGCLYASKYTSLVTPDGVRQANLLLADVLGVSYRSETKESFTYMAPAEGQEPLFAPYTRQHPAGIHGPQLIVEPCPGAQVWGELVLPYTDPADPVRFASIHNNPPGVYTRAPAIIHHRLGRGQAIYVTGDLENAPPQYGAHHDLFVRLIRRLCDSFSFEADAPKSVEMTLFHQPDRRRFIASLVNFQKELPNIPVDGIRVRIRLGGKRPRRLLLLPKETEWTYTICQEGVEFVVPRLETLAMFALEYG